jgi:hypothetical protein
MSWRNQEYVRKWSDKIEILVDNNTVDERVRVMKNNEKL